MNGEAVHVGGLLGCVDLPGVAESVARARRFVCDVLTGVGAAADEAVLMVSELVSNSVRHSDSGWRAGGQITVVVAHCGDAVQVEVIDEGSATNVPCVPERLDEDAESGRGLWTVGKLALTWGWQEDVAGRVVWFQVPALASDTNQGAGHG